MIGPATESTEERIIAAVASTLSGIEKGTRYWYTPMVQRVDHWNDKRLYQPAKSPIYFVRDTSELTEAQPLRQYGLDARVLTAYVLCAFYDDRANHDPYTLRAPSPGTIRHRMIRDVTKAMYANSKLDGLVIDLDVSDPIKDFEEGLAPWILAEVPIVVLFEHRYDEP